jgi:translation initiation factor IF-2
MPVKIFELAKELDIGAIDLVEQLRTKGYSIRNHMSSLSEDEAEEVRKSFAAPEPAAKTTKKKAKKKTTKKAAKKKVTKKAAATGEKETKVAKKASASTEEDKPKKKVVKKKRTVIRKKTSKSAKEETAEEVSEESTVQATATEVSEETKVETSEVATEKESTGGLKVVSRPEVKQEEAPAEPEKEEKPELYKEKVHRFTPVYVPEKSETTETQSAQGDDDGSSELSEEDQKKKDENSKKRLGGLASMMSKKKGSISKSQALNMSRSESELKNYSALSGTGRPIYTSIKKKRAYSGPSKGTEITEVKDSKRVIKLHGGGTIQDISRKLKVRQKDLVDQCLDLNLLVKGEDFIGMKLAEKIAALYSYRVEDVAFDEDKMIGKETMTAEEKEKLPLRDPIIAIMGHVDHGKTTLLDFIRNSSVVDGEAGGITQHIGAYSVKTKSGKKLTFLDTPGHAAFASMRQRGANATDIVILVVAADDGVMPQTKESIRFIENAGVPMIVAINKMDKEGANPDRVKQELTEFNITPEEWGGETLMVPVSALKGEGVDDLLEAVALQAEMGDLRADPKGKAEGVVIEAKIEQGRGPVATILIQSGTLKKGDSIVVGESYGRARSLTDTTGGNVDKAGPSIPVQIIGLNDAPSPGDILNVVKNEREAKKIVQNRVDERKKVESVSAKPEGAAVSLEDFFSQATATVGEKKALNLIVRSDVQGSYEAIKQSLEPMSNNEVDVKIIAGGVGPISDSDVQLASSASAIIVGFNMRPVTSARKMAEQMGIEVRTYSIIYELINDVTLALEGMLEPEFKEKYIGRVEVKETFSVPKVGVIAGSVVIDGSISVGCQVRLLRDGQIMFDGTMSSLKRFKDDVKEVKSGYECGVGLENYNDIKIGDIFEAYIMEEHKRTLKDVQIAAEKASENQMHAE